MPPDFDAASLSSVTGAQIKFWVDQTNAAPGWRVLTKLVKVDDLKRRLGFAMHYHLNLTVAPPAVAATAPSPSLTLDIQNRQWNTLFDVEDEREDSEECTCTNKLFLLGTSSPGEHKLASISKTPNLAQRYRVYRPPTDVQISYKVGTAILAHIESTAIQMVQTIQPEPVSHYQINTNKYKYNTAEVLWGWGKTLLEKLFAYCNQAWLQ